MRIRRPSIFGLLNAASVAVIIISGLMWVRSFYRVDWHSRIRRTSEGRSYVVLLSTGGRLNVAYLPPTFANIEADWAHGEGVRSGSYTYFGRADLSRFYGVRFERYVGFYSELPRTQLTVGYWVFILLAAPWPIVWFARFRRRRHALEAGLCVRCGYDLRASAERCPECGTSIGVTACANG